MRWMCDTQQEHFNRLHLKYEGISHNGKTILSKLTLSDIEHSLCEVITSSQHQNFFWKFHQMDKYTRHQYAASKKSFAYTRQSKFEAKSTPIEYCIPKYWSDPSTTSPKIKPKDPENSLKKRKIEKIEVRFSIEKILKHRGKGEDRQYYVHWEGNFIFFLS